MHVSGREVRVALQPNALYEFEAKYGGLTSAASGGAAQGLTASSLQTMMGFYMQMQGQANTFLYSDPDDNTIAAGPIWTGDGTTQSFVIGRTLGGWNEPVSWVTGITTVYLNGVAQSSGSWSFTAPNCIVFAVSPGAGVAITADFTFAFQCRFLEDDMDFEENMSTLWKLDSMKFRSVKANTLPAPVPAPTVTGISPSSGSTSGGASVTVTGTFFIGATAVSIGGVAATGITVVNSTTITCTTGAHAAGVVNVSVTTPSGTGTGTNLYTYALPLLLDSITTAATAAYSTRKLRAAYAGYAINVRRSSDNTAQDIGFSAANDLDTVGLLAFVGSGNGFVTKWYDQSGNGYDQSQSTAGNQPQIVSSGVVITTINSIPSIQFNGTSSKLANASAPLSDYVSAAAYSALALSRPTAGSGSYGAGSAPGIFGDVNQEYFFHGFNGSGFVAAHYNSGQYEADVAATYPNVLVTTAQYDGSHINGYVNGGSGTSTSAPNISIVTHTCGIGNIYSSYYFAGAIAEFITFNVALAKADENTLGANMASRGGVSWTTIP
jgi:hypothetical protein